MPAPPLAPMNPGMSIPWRRRRGVRTTWWLVRAVALVALAAGAVRVYPRHGVPATLLYLAACACLIVVTVLGVVLLVWVARWIGRTGRETWHRIARARVKRNAKTAHGNPDHGFQEPLPSGPSKAQSIGEKIGTIIVAPLAIAYALATVLGFLLVPVCVLGYAFWVALRIVILALR